MKAFHMQPAYEIDCPKCKAIAGCFCESRGKFTFTPHVARIRAALQQAKKETGRDNR